MRSSLMKGKKAKSVWQQKEKKKSLLPISMWCSAASWEARTSARITAAQEHLDNGCPPFSPGFLAVWHHTVGDILLVSLGQLSWPCPLLTSSPAPDYWPLGGGIGEGALVAQPALLSSSRNMGVPSTLLWPREQSAELYGLLWGKGALSQPVPAHVHKGSCGKSE